MEPRASTALPVVLVALLLAAATPADAAAPRSTTWDSITLEGPPAAAGFLDAGYVVYGVGDSGSAIGQESGPCATNGTDADVYLVSFPSGPGCVQAIDASGSEVGSEGVIDLATAEKAGLVVAALDPTDPPGGSDPEIVGWRLEDGQLTRAFSRGLAGPARIVDTDPHGQRVLVAVETDGDSSRLSVRGADGSNQAGFSLRGPARALSISDNARYAAIGGNFTQGSTSFGWVHLYDLSRSRDANPVLAREFERARAGIVSSVTVTDQGTLYTGSLDGTVTLVRPEGIDRTLKVANGTAHVATDPTGSTIVASAADRLVSLTGAPDTLEAAWSNPVNGTAASATVRGSYVFTAADEFHAFDRSGKALWTIPRGAVNAANQTGLGLVVATGAGVDATGDTLSSLAGHVVHAEASIQQTGPVPSVSPGDIALVNLSVENTGAAILNVTLSSDPAGSTRAQLAPSTFTLHPGARQKVNATVKVGPGESPGPLDVPVELLGRPATRTLTNLTVDVGTAANVSVRPEPGTLLETGVARGQDLTVRFLIENRGNADADVTVETEQALSRGGLWSVSLNPGGLITVAKGTTTTVRMDVQVPDEAANGTTNRIVFRARTGGQAAAASLTLTVNPFEALTLTPQSITKRMAPGATSAYTFTLTNHGSVPANTTLAAQALDDAGEIRIPTDWGLALDRSRFELPAGEADELTLEIAAPPNGTAEDAIRVQLLATSQGGAQASSLAFGVVDPALAEEPDEPKREPLPAIIPILGLLAAAALLRRSHDDNL